MGCSLPGSSVHGILQASLLEGVAVPFSQVSNPGLPHCSQILYCFPEPPRKPIHIDEKDYDDDYVVVKFSGSRPYGDYYDNNFSLSVTYLVEE